jgi:hypothetical protein
MSRPHVDHIDMRSPALAGLRFKLTLPHSQTYDSLYLFLKSIR